VTKLCRERIQAGLLVISVLTFPAWGFSAEKVAVKWVGGVGNSLSQPPDFYGSKEAVRIAETVLLYQRDNGGWPQFYRIGTNRPIFCSRDGVPRDTL